MSLGKLFECLDPHGSENGRICVNHHWLQVRTIQNGLIYCNSHLKIRGDVRLEVFVPARDDIDDSPPTGTYFLSGRVEDVITLNNAPPTPSGAKPSRAKPLLEYILKIRLTTTDEDLARRRHNRIPVYNVSLQYQQHRGRLGRIQVIDMGYEGIAVRSQGNWVEGDRIAVVGMEEFVRRISGPIVFEVKSNYDELHYGLKARYDTDSQRDSFREYCQKLERYSRLFRFLWQHADSLLQRGEVDTHLVSLEEIDEELRGSDILPAFMPTEKYCALVQTLRAQDAYLRVKREIDSLQKHVAKLKKGEQRRVSEIGGFVDSIGISR